MSGASFLPLLGLAPVGAQLLFDGQDGAGGRKGRDGQRECQCLSASLSGSICLSLKCLWGPPAGKAPGREKQPGLTQKATSLGSP